MIDSIWSGRNPLWRLLLPFSLLYAGVSGLNRLAYRLGLRARYQAPVPVIVVGNITAGGSGKTPVVIWLIEYLKQQGYHPAVVSRGYGGRAANYPLRVSADTNPAESGDEPLLIYRRTGVPVIVAPKRVAAVKLALQQDPTIDVIITDDGLQHYALQRDIEIVVVDGNRRFGNGWWLPAGPLRESQRRLAQVDAVIINGGPVFTGELSMQLKPGPITRLTGGTITELDSQREVIAVAGIGHPPRFFNTLRTMGLAVAAEYAFADHYAFRVADLQPLVQDNQLLIMTEKDAVKCQPFAEDNWCFLPVSTELAGSELSILLEKIIQLIKAGNAH
jgi:tetraacyldisaccharide 4'-kinase